MSKLVKVIAAASQLHEGRRYRIGDTFFVSEGEAADLVALRFASMAPPEPEQDKDKRRYKRRDMEPES